MKQGDYANAILVLNRGIQQDPSNLALSKDLALSYYLQRDNEKALQVIEPLLDRSEADDQCFQIAGSIYKAASKLKECEKMYKKGIRKFPNSGPLYNEYGELLLAQNDKEAIELWEKGINAEPSYSRNYYNAARYYNLFSDPVKTVLYGEIFINTEPLGRNTPEIKDILLSSYKKLFSNANLEQIPGDRTSFEKAFLQTMNKQSSVAVQGINTETLTMIRARFILDWSNSFKTKYPYKLFELHQQLLQEGMFDAYNQWIFGSSENLVRYQQWTINHKEEYTAFINFQKSRNFKMPAGQNYK